MANTAPPSVRSFLFLWFFGFFVVGNLVLSLLLRLAMQTNVLDISRQTATLLNTGFLLLSFAFVSILSFRLRMPIFLYSFILVAPLACLATTFLYGFHSPFSLFAYFVDAMLSGRSFPEFSYSR